MTKNLRIAILAGLLPFLSTTHAVAQTWTGSVNSDWFNASNWSPATVPGNSSAPTIPGSLATYPTLTGNVIIGGLTMNSGSALHLAGFFVSSSGAADISGATIDGGGNFNLISPPALSFIGNTIVAALNITGYTGGANILNNTITGNTLITDAPTQNNGTNYIDGNLITGTLTLTHASATDNMLEGYGGSAGNHITGNVLINLTGAGSFYSSYSHSLQVDGNLTVNRTSAGYTSLYDVAGAGVNGNFTYSTVGGDSYINAGNATSVPIGGTINLSANSSGIFHMYRLKNTLAGGTVTNNGSSNVDIQGDTLKASVNITGYTGGAIFFNNSFTGATAIADAPTQNNAVNYVDGNLFAGSLSLTHSSATDEMDEGYGGVTGNHVTGNATINLNGAGAFNSSYSHPLLVDGNLTISRTVAGNTTLYNVPGGAVNGNLSLSTVGGNCVINPGNNTTVVVGGTMNITNATAALFHMYRMKNNTAGGTITINGSNNADLQGDTLKAMLNVTAYTGGCSIFNNSIQGNTIIGDAPTQANGLNYIDGNLFTGNLTLNHSSQTDEMDEGYGAANGNNVTGNATFNISGAGAFLSSYSHGIRIGGNLTVSRTVNGQTTLYRVLGEAANIGGNFSYTTTGGDSYINAGNAYTVNVGGTYNITSPTANQFRMNRMKNSTPGGNVSVEGATTLEALGDTLLATISLTNYTGTCNVLNNSFTGNTNLSDAAIQNSSNNYVDGNLFAGSLTIIHASATDILYEGYGASNGNHVTGSAAFNLTGAGGFESSYSHSLQVDGNLTVNRSVTGPITLYKTAGGGVNGNFSLTTAGGDVDINSANSKTVPVGGTFSISAPVASYFHLYRMKNNTAGGTVTIAGSNNLDINGDTLKANVSLTNYVGAANILNNAILGTTNISDAPGQSTGNNNIDGNLFTGNLNLTHASATDIMYEGSGGTTNNHVTGNAGVTLNGAGGFYSSYAHSLQVDGNLTINRTVPGLTYLYRSPGGGINNNFSCSAAGGDFVFNPGNGVTIPVGGTVTISAPSSGVFSLNRLKNAVSGGAVTVAGSNNIDMRNDTLAANISLTSYTSSFNMLDNKITGNTLVADAVTQNTGNNNFDGNELIGRLTLVHNSTTDILYDGNGSPSGNGNVVHGKDSIVNTPGAAGMYLGYAHAHRADSTLVLSSNAGMNVSSLVFGGNTGGHLRLMGTQPFSVSSLMLNKTTTAPMILDTALTISGNLSFTAGYMTTTATHPLLFANGATQTGASDASHIQGTVLKAGNQAFTFPIGTGTAMTAIGISAPATATDTIMASFALNNPYDTSITHRAGTLQRVSGCKHWELTHVSGNSAVMVTLQYGPPCNGVTNPPALRVAHYNGTVWEDLGNGGTTGTNTQGFVTAGSAIASFSPFTLGTTDAISNPLPVSLIDFKAEKKDRSVAIEWSVTAGEEVASYQVERSVNGKEWAPLGDALAALNSKAAHGYQTMDEQPVSGENFYRLQIHELNGTVAISPVRMVKMDEVSSGGAFSVYPNPVIDQLHLDGNIRTAILTNTEGKVIETLDRAGTINMSALPSGLYLLQLTGNNGSRQSLKVIRQ